MNQDEEPVVPPFHRKYFADREDLVAARWWQDAMTSSVWVAPGLADQQTRRRMLLLVGGTFAVGIFSVRACQDTGAAEDDYDVASYDVLEAQRRFGWAVGTSGVRLAYAGASLVDAAGRADWRDSLGSLGSELAPTRTALLPYFVPTLFQVLGDGGFAADVVPVHTPAMDSAERQGRALADLFKNGHDDTAILIDAPGPLAVAAAAGVADRFEPVFIFDNWPHPRGVVASHEVIAAAVYHRPTFARARAQRRPGAPPAFIVDSRRLAPYQDESDLFDNRYLARLPGAEQFQTLGIRHLLYVSESPVAHEPDDLNDDFVALDRGGVDVKTATLDDFRPMEIASDGSANTTLYSYGGSPSPHYWFWHSYGWYQPVPPAGARFAPPTVKLSDGAAYRPVSRPTIFSSHAVGGLPGVGKQKPSGFGRVSFRTSRTTGVVSIGRSGSLGRSRTSYGG